MSLCTTGVVDTGGNMPPASLTPVAIYWRRVNTVNKFASVVAVNLGKDLTGGDGVNLPLVSTTPVVNLPLVWLIPTVHLEL